MSDDVFATGGAAPPVEAIPDGRGAGAARSSTRATGVRVCVFDLDHTLVASPLDLAAMALDMRALIERELGALPSRPDRYRVGELIAHGRAAAPELEPALWAIALEHEERALAGATLEPGALDAIVGARGLGFATAVWTNNARACTAHVLGAFRLAPHLDLVVTRDDMRHLKPDPDGFRVIRERFPELAAAVVVGDSWVDGLAARAAGLPFIAYRAREGELAHHGVTPDARIESLAGLVPLLARLDRSVEEVAAPRDGRDPSGPPGASGSRRRAAV
jgi:phosphoglycolate phosphatase